MMLNILLNSIHSSLVSFITSNQSVSHRKTRHTCVSIGDEDGSTGHRREGFVFFFLGGDDVLQARVPRVHRFGNDTFEKDFVVKNVPESVLNVT